MDLYSFHRVLISAAILFDFLFTFWAVRQWRVDSDPMMLVMAVGSSVVTITLVAYLVYFNRSLAVLRHTLAGRRGA